MQCLFGIWFYLWNNLLCLVIVDIGLEGISMDGVCSSCRELFCCIEYASVDRMTGHIDSLYCCILFSSFSGYSFNHELFFYAQYSRVPFISSKVSNIGLHCLNHKANNQKPQARHKCKLSTPFQTAKAHLHVTNVSIDI